MSYLHLPDLAGLLFKHETINTLTSGAPFFPQYFPPAPSTLVALAVQPTHGPHRNPEETEVLRNQLKFLARLQDGELPLQFHDLSSFMFVQLPKYLKDWIPQGQQCFQFGTSRQVFFCSFGRQFYFCRWFWSSGNTANKQHDQNPPSLATGKVPLEQSRPSTLHHSLIHPHSPQGDEALHLEAAFHFSTLTSLEWTCCLGGIFGAILKLLVQQKHITVVHVF